MPRLALVLVAIWFVSLFVVRSVIQWQRTGSTGFKGFHGRPGSLPWLAGVSVSAGLAISVMAPVAMLLGWPGGAPIVDVEAVHLIGAGLSLLATAGALKAQLAMGDSWRVGVDEGEVTRLVRSGLFGWVRNPVFSFMGLSALGLLLLVPNALAIAGGAVFLVGIEVQVRVVEEPFLARVHGADYADYAARVGRFVPGLGLLRSSRSQRDHERSQGDHERSQDDPASSLSAPRPH